MKILLYLWYVVVSTLAFMTVAKSTSPDEFKQKFIEEQVKKGYTKQQIESFLKPAKKNKVVIDAIQRQWESKPWFEYYPIFLTSNRIKAGVDFWKKNRENLARAEKKFQVNPEIIVSIIGVETFFGKNMGSFNVRNALFSLGFHYPPRGSFFSSELGHLMDLIQKENLNPETLTGSFAGAIGYGQFIPSSYMHYAVDFNGDGKRDLTNVVDAIGSVANYFKNHGWQYQQPVAFPAKVKGEPKKMKSLLWGKSPPSTSLEEWQMVGVEPKTGIKLHPREKAVFFQLAYKNKVEYWVGLKNFYVITRYNHSQLYAMAVYLLSQKIKDAYEKS